MSNEALAALITGVFAGFCAVVAALGTWLGRKPSPANSAATLPTNPVFQEDINSRIKLILEQNERRIVQLETQRDEREKRIEVLEEENRQLRDKVAELENQVELMKGRETQRNGT